MWNNAANSPAHEHYRYSLIAKNLDWYSALDYCHKNHLGDLVPIRNARQQADLTWFLSTQKGMFVVCAVETWVPTGLNFRVHRMKSERKGNPPIPCLPLKVGTLKSS